MSDMTPGDYKVVKSLLDDETIDAVCELRTAQAEVGDLRKQIDMLNETLSKALHRRFAAEDRAAAVLNIPIAHND